MLTLDGVSVVDVQDKNGVLLVDTFWLLFLGKIFEIKELVAISMIVHVNTFLYIFALKRINILEFHGFILVFLEVLVDLVLGPMTNLWFQKVNHLSVGSIGHVEVWKEHFVELLSFSAHMMQLVVQLLNNFNRKSSVWALWDLIEIVEINILGLLLLTCGVGASTQSVSLSWGLLSNNADGNSVSE